jgi:hypothetical protein
MLPKCKKHAEYSKAVKEMLYEPLDPDDDDLVGDWIERFDYIASTWEAHVKNCKICTEAKERRRLLCSKVNLTSA